MLPMIRLRALRSGILTVAVASVMSGLNAQEHRPSFTASISTPRATVSSGSAIRVDITLNNQTSDLIIVDGLRTSPSGAGIIVRDGDGNLIQPVESARDSPEKTRRGLGTAIPSGKSVTESVNVSKWFDLNKAGEYSLQVQKRDPITKMMVYSNKLTITILPKS